MTTERLIVGLVFAGLMTAAARRVAVVTDSGAVAGFLIAAALPLAPTWAPLALFVLFVVFGSASSRLGAEKKRALGVMQENDGRRSWIHAVANTGFAALAILAGLADPRHAALFEIGACGSLAAMLADTTASEWGTWLGGRPRSILTWRRVPIGADGGVTLTGTLAAFVAALAAALVAAALRGDFRATLSAVAVAGVVGNTVDSMLGATVEPRLGKHGGAIVNALAASAGGAAAMFVMASV